MKKIIIIGMFIFILLISIVKSSDIQYGSADGTSNGKAVSWNNSNVHITFWGNLNFTNISDGGATSLVYLDAFQNFYVYNLTDHSIVSNPAYGNANITLRDVSKTFILTEQFNLTEDLAGMRSIGAGLIDEDINLTSDSDNFTKKFASASADNITVSFSGRVDSCYFISTPSYTSDSGNFNKNYTSSEYICDNTTKWFDLNLTDIDKSSGNNILYLDSILPNGTVDSPIDNINYPDTSNIDINFTILDDRQVQYIWYNVENSTNDITKANSTPQFCGEIICGDNFSQVSFPIAVQEWLNLYANQSDGQEVLIGRVNLSVQLDTSAPDITITNQDTLSSQNIVYQFLISDNDIGVANATYEVYLNSTGNSIIGNTTISNPSSNTSVSFNTNSDSDFVFKIEATDNNNNIGFATDEFSVNTGGGAVTPASTGGGAVPSLECDEGGIKWAIFPRAFDLQLGKNSVRTTTLEILNNGTEKVDFTAKCDDTSVTNFTKNACNFVNISHSIFSVEPNIKQPFIYKVEITAPEEAEFGDAFSFGIFFDDGKACKGTVSGLAEITLGRGSLFKLIESREIAGVNIPLILPVLFIIFIPSFIGFLARKTFFLTFPITVFIIAPILTFLFLVVV